MILINFPKISRIYVICIAALFNNILYLFDKKIEELRMLINRKLKIVSRYIKTYLWLNEIAMDHQLFYDELIAEAIKYSLSCSDCEVSEYRSQGLGYFSFDCKTENVPVVTAFWEYLTASMLDLRK